MKLIDQYHEICTKISNEFNKKYFDGDADMYNIGNDFDGVWGVNDYYFNLSDMAIALELDVKEKELFSWYDQWTDPDNNNQINLRNWHKLVNSKLK